MCIWPFLVFIIIRNTGAASSYNYFMSHSSFSEVKYCVTLVFRERERDIYIIKWSFICIILSTDMSNCLNDFLWCKWLSDPSLLKEV